MSNIITTIPKGRPEHIVLDFDLLRAEGILHLESLATEVWTDFNAHDPGITTLELLCYAITDLGYRTRMLPIADLMAGNDPTKKTWFTATEVLPNAPVTERDLRKLLIDVKGVKNAWFRKAKPWEIVMMLYRSGWVFKNLMTDKQEWDESALRALAQSQNIPFPERVKNPDGTTTKESAKAIAAYLRCLNDFLLSLESNPNLQQYNDLIDEITMDMQVWDAQYLHQEKQEVLTGIKALEGLELDRFFSERDNKLTAEQISALVTNAAFYLPLHTQGEAFPALPDDLETLVGLYRPYNVAAYDSHQYKEVYRSFQLKGLDKEIETLGYEVIPQSGLILTDLLVLLKEFQDDDLTDFTYNEAGVTNFFEVDAYTELVGKATLLIKLLNEEPTNLVKLTPGQETAIKSFIDTLKKKITINDKTVLIEFLDGDDEKHVDRINRKAFTNLWTNELPKLNNKTVPTWLDLEKSEYSRMIKPSAKKGAKTSKTSADGSFSFAAFKTIVNQRLVERDELENHWKPLLAAYVITTPIGDELNLGYIAVGNFLNQAFGISTTNIVISQILQGKPGEDAACKNLSSYLLEHLCDYGFHGLTLDSHQAHEYYPDPIPLNGIYRVVLDLDATINTANSKQVEMVVNRAMNRLHENRNLCEDFLTPQVVEQRPVHFCIHLDVSPDMDERVVMAEVIWRFQEYLTPTLHFRSFKEMHALGLHCDDIYNGPLLDNGFLDDTEVDNAQLLEEYYYSDLVRIAMGTPGVLGVRELQVRATPEGKVADSEGLKLTEGPVYSIYPALEKGESIMPPFIKRVIDLCDSCFFVSKGALLPIKLTEDALHEQLEWLEMTRNCEFCTEAGGHIPASGTYRADLTEFRSIQYDLPAVYTVGDHHVSDNDTLLRKAQARQLQAYLSFFDQILAAYLAQLGQVNQLLSIEQDTTAATRVLPALYEVPGVRELIEYQAAFTAKAEDWVVALERVPDADHATVRTALGALATSTTNFTGFYAFRQQLSTLLSADHHAAYTPLLSDYFWEKYAADEANNYRQALATAAETSAHRQQHRDRLLDHLLARFGESFGTYVHALLAPDAEPEDNPWRQDFEGYLQDKARFLRDVAMLSHDRSRGYNYRQMSAITHQPDVWSSANVAGVKKRVSRLVGIDDFTQKSLIAEPPYRLDIVQSQNKQGNAQFRIVLKKRPEAAIPGENPIQAGPLMYSQRYTSKKKTQDKVTELYKTIWKTSLFKTEPSASDSDKWVVRFTLPDNELISDPFGEEEVKGLLRLIQDLVQPGKEEAEGFHIIEHILLRPNDPKDQLLQIPLGCDPKETPYDPYSFWITVILPNWTSRFKHADFRYFFEQTFRAETPAHIAIRFCWVDLNTMYLFENAFRKWLIEKAKCTPSECHVTDAANTLIHSLNTMPCTCHCAHEEPENLCDDCGKPGKH